jgi:hypothetical protein
MADSTFNLTVLSERLFSEGRLKPLAGKIKVALDMTSAHTDLVIALETLDALDALLAAPPADDTPRAAAESALLNTAVVLYARATKTQSDARKTFDNSANFTAEEKAVHQEPIDLRDDAIAHFGSGGSYRGMWQAEAVILQRSPTGVVRVGVAIRRQTLDKKLAARARKHIERVRPIFEASSQQKIGEVTAELNGLTPDDFEKEIGPHRFNLDIFMATSEAANAPRASADDAGSYVKGVVRHAP